MQGVATLFENSRKVYCDSSSHTPIFRSRTDVGAKVKAKASFINENDEPVSDGFSKNKFAYSLMAGVRYSF